MTRAQRRPFKVRCGACGHVFAPLYLPMQMLTAASVLKSARCPRCGAGSDRLFVHVTQKPPTEHSNA